MPAAISASPSPDQCLLLYYARKLFRPLYGVCHLVTHCPPVQDRSHPHRPCRDLPGRPGRPGAGNTGRHPCRARYQRARPAACTGQVRQTATHFPRPARSAQKVHRLVSLHAGLPLFAERASPTGVCAPDERSQTGPGCLALPASHRDCLARTGARLCPACAGALEGGFSPRHQSQYLPPAIADCIGSHRTNGRRFAGCFGRCRYRQKTGFYPRHSRTVRRQQKTACRPGSRCARAAKGHAASRHGLYRRRIAGAYAIGRTSVPAGAAITATIFVCQSACRQARRATQPRVACFDRAGFDAGQPSRRTRYRTRSRSRCAQIHGTRPFARLCAGLHQSADAGTQAD